MNTAEQILVIILSSVLAIFLLLAIVVAAKLIRLIKTLQTIATSAKELVTSAEKTADAVRSTVGQISVLRFLHNIYDFVQKNEKKKDSK